MRKRKNKGADEDYWRNIKKDIDEGYRYFWKKRGYDEPPSASFGNITFGKLIKKHHKSQ